MKFTQQTDSTLSGQPPIPDLAPSVYGVVADSARKYAHRTALKFLPDGKAHQVSKSYSYSEFLQQVTAAANMFRDLGIDDSSVVTYILPNLPETLFTVYGAETAGIVNAVNPMLEPEHIIDIMKEVESKVLVTLAPLPEVGLWEKAQQIIPNVPSLSTVLSISLLEEGRADEELGSFGDVQVFDFTTQLSKYPSDALAFQRVIKPSDVASYFHTGGTTGQPKIAQHTHDNEIFNAWALEKQLGLTDAHVFFCGLPWFHVNGVIVTGLVPLTGGHSILLGSPSGYRGEGIIENFWKIVNEHNVSFFSCVPTILQMLLDVPIAGEDVSSLRYALCGAAPLSEQLLNEFEKATGIKILEGYGFTEGTCGNSANPADGIRKVGSIGIPNLHHDMKVAILDDHKRYLRDAEVDEIGAIVAKGRNIFPGYKKAEQNQGIFIDDGTHKWYNTGDLGRMDRDGYFWLTGRKKELIIRGGHNIDPKTIEEPLSKHPAVAAAAAVPRPDKRVGELPAVYIQLKPNQTCSVEELLAFAKTNIMERAAVPKFIRIVDKLPLTAVGKVFKPALARLQIKEVFEEELSTLQEIRTAEVTVVQHPKEGVLAKISIEASTDIGEPELAHLVKDVLGSYTVKYELKKDINEY